MSVDAVLGDTGAFIDALVSALKTQYPSIPITDYEMDHICYRCDSVGEYTAVCKQMDVYTVLVFERDFHSRMHALHANIMRADGMPLGCLCSYC
jgi:hypothetical protein